MPSINMGKNCEKCGTKISSSCMEGVCTACLLEVALQPPFSTPRQKEFDDLELLEEIGRGGMGVVYRARQKGLKREVAIKMILRGSAATEDELRRFQKEAEAAAQLQHPNIVRIHGIGQIEGQPYFTMDYVKGRTLDRVIDRKPVDPKTAAQYLRKICDAVQYAHDHRILHRDLKPSNVLIDENDEPHVLDFGVSRHLDEESSLTLTGQLLGSPNYMAPEQAAGRHDEVSQQSDIYSLGALLYHLITGHPPFRSRSVAETLHQLQTSNPIPPRWVNRSIPLDLETICFKCLEKDPKQRYATAQALASDLELFLGGKPIRARRVSTAVKLWRACKRNPATAGITSALVLTLVSAFFITLHRTQLEADRERKRSAAAQKAQQTEERLRKEAEATNFRLTEVVNRLELQKAEDFFTQSDSSTAMASLARILRENPSNFVAAERALSALLLRDFGVLESAPIEHEAPVFYAAFSPDGLQLITISADKSAQIWNAATGARITKALKHESDVTTARFSPDGSRVVTASVIREGRTRGYARIWDAKTGEPLTPPLWHKDIITSAQFSPHGLYVLTASLDGTAKLWDGRTGELSGRPLHHRSQIASAMFSADGLRIVTASWDKTARIWDTRTGQLIKEITGVNAPLAYAEFSPDGKKVVTASGDQFKIGNYFSSRDPDEKGVWNAQVWDSITGERLTQPLQHWAPIMSAHFSPDGDRIVTASHDKTAMIWDARSLSLPRYPLNPQLSTSHFSPQTRKAHPQTH